MAKNKSDIRVITTATDVAREAGVSQAAVSRAFTPGASVAPTTRAKILRAAEKLGYRPNLIARSLTSGRSNIVGVGMGNLRNPFFAEALEMFSLALERAGLRLLLFPVTRAATLDTEFAEVLRYRLDALILLSTTLTSTLASQCASAGVPVVLFNRTGGDFDISSVIGDNEVGSRTIAAFLHAGGHVRPAMITGLPGSSTGEQRERGFMSYFRDAGAATPLTECGSFDQDTAMAAARRLLARTERPDAIFCANDQMAMAAINVARFEYGLEPGRDLSIVGYDDVPQASWPCFALTTFAQPTQQMVDRTVEIVRLLQDQPDAIRNDVLAGQLRVRASARLPILANGIAHG